MRWDLPAALREAEDNIVHIEELWGPLDLWPEREALATAAWRLDYLGPGQNRSRWL